MLEFLVVAVGTNVKLLHELHEAFARATFTITARVSRGRARPKSTASMWEAAPRLYLARAERKGRRLDHLLQR
eukprot:4683532-Pleurochrysis_carterae.AAC.1